MESRKSFSLSISLSFSLKFKNVLQQAFTYSSQIQLKNARARCALCLKITNKDTGKT